MNNLILPFDDDNESTPSLETMIARVKGERGKKKATQNETLEPTNDQFDERLVAIAQRWLDSSSGDYEDALRMTKDITTTARAAGLLATHPPLTQHRQCWALGSFISALWNSRCPEQFISYDHRTPDINFLGLYLTREKTLIITGETGAVTGSHADGVILLTGRTGRDTGVAARGPLIIAGTAAGQMGRDATGPIIATTEVDRDKTHQGCYISSEQYAQNRGLKIYVGRLIRLATRNLVAIEQEYGNGITIDRTINELIAMVQP